MICKLVSAACLLILSSLSYASQDAYTVRAVDLKQMPQFSSNSLTTLAKETRLTILQRQGGWYQVTAKEHTGWLKMLSIRFAPVPRAEAKVQETAHYSASTTLTTGVRGLAESGLGKNGQGAALEQIHSLRVSKEDAETFARSAGLKSREVDHVE